MGSVMETEWSENVELLIVCSRAGSVIAKYRSLLVPFDLRVGTSSFDDGMSYLVTIDIDYAGEEAPITVSVVDAIVVGETRVVTIPSSQLPTGIHRLVGLIHQPPEQG